MIFDADVAEGVAGMELGLSPAGHFVLAKAPNRAVLPLAQFGDVLLAIDGHTVQGNELSEVVAKLKACPRPLTLRFASPQTPADRRTFYGSADPLPTPPHRSNQLLLSFLIPSVVCLLCTLCSCQDALSKTDTHIGPIANFGPMDGAAAILHAEKRLPFVMSSAAAAWPAIHRWQNHSYLREALGGVQLEPVYTKPRSTPPVFWWVDQSKPLHMDLPPQRLHDVQSLEVGELLEQILQSRTSHLKCSALFSGAAFHRLQQDTVHTHNGTVNGTTGATIPNVMSTLSNGIVGTRVLWVGGPSAFQMHYDTSQVNGPVNASTILITSQIFLSMHPPY
jgi:hypothetical protein